MFDAKRYSSTTSCTFFVDLAHTGEAACCLSLAHDGRKAGQGGPMGGECAFGIITAPDVWLRAAGLVRQLQLFTRHTEYPVVEISFGWRLLHRNREDRTHRRM